MSNTTAPAELGVDPATCESLREFVTRVADKRGLTMKAFAEQIGVSRSKFFAGLRDPQTAGAFIDRLAKFSGVPAQTLTGLKGERARIQARQTPLRAMVTKTAAKRGVTVSALVEQTGVARTTVFDLMAGRGQGTPSTLAALATVLEVDVVEVAKACGAELNAVSAARVRTGMTRAAFAEHLGVSEASLAAAEAGKPLRSDVVAKLAAAIGDGDAQRQLNRTRQAACSTATPVGKAIDAFCAREAITFREASRRANLSHQHLAQIVTGAIRAPGPEVRARLADLLDITVQDVDAMFVDVTTPHARAGARLAARRTKAGLTQAQVAAELGVVAPAVSMWETGAAPVPERHRAPLSKLLAR